MVDLHVGPDQASATEREVIDAALGPDGFAVVHQTERLVRSGERRRAARRHLLLPALHALQAEVGWISPGGVNHLADRLQVPPAEIYGVATFYDLFRTTDPGRAAPVSHVCVDAPCLINGAAAEVARRRDAGEGVHESPCLGQCERAPAVFVQGCGEPDHVPADEAEDSVAAWSPAAPPRLLERVMEGGADTLAGYRAHGGYAALAEAHRIGPDAVIDRVSASGLSGRGGAGFPTGTKWRAVADAEGHPKFVVANADESEPGTFKDRILMEADPFALIEALTIAGHAVGAEQGWIYVRGEYPRATARLVAAIDAARAEGVLGGAIGEVGQRFDIEMRRGAGAYICGEETALFNSIEGFRGEPRNKPPYPTTHGLFGRPTAVNNPETLANVLPILTAGVDAHRAIGTEQSPGTKLFCVSGTVTRPGLYEAPFGTNLSELLGWAGAPAAPAAVLLGGAAGRFVPPDRLDLELSMEAARDAGLSLGSGAVMVFGAADDLPAVVTRVAEFFRHESCGQCVPCRVGTVRQHELLVRSGSNGGLTDDDRVLLDDLARVMEDASICGLGHTAAGAVESAVALGLLGGAR